MAYPRLSRAKAVETVDAIRAAVSRGALLPEQAKPGQRTAHGAARQALGLDAVTFKNRLARIALDYPDLLAGADLSAPVAGAPAFSIDPSLTADEPFDADALIDELTAKHERRAQREKRLELIPVKINTPGPIAIAFMGDPHIDDPGCAWGDLKRDVDLIARTPGAFAIALGDYRNNWVGRLTALYADHHTPHKQTLKLIEWLFGSTALGPKLLAAVLGNHDEWNTLGGDPVKFIHRLAGGAGFYGAPAYRMELGLPSGARVRLHVRHDFKGHSQFNPSHGLVKETLWNYRDHILACGDRHHAGYMPVWHNDPEPRLCHALRVGTYKDFDPYAETKGFKHENWSRCMVAVIDPRYANDPVRFIRIAFSVPEGMDMLRMVRAEWERESKPAKRAR